MLHRSENFSKSQLMSTQQQRSPVCCCGASSIRFVEMIAITFGFFGILPGFYGAVLLKPGTAVFHTKETDSPNQRTLLRDKGAENSTEV